MAETAQDGTNEGDVNDTPSTASRIKQSVVENAFPTPPRRSLHAGSLSRAGQTLAPPLRAALGIRRAASTPPDNRHDPSRQLYPQVPISRAETARSSDKLTWHKQELTKRKSQYLEKAFAIREPSYSAKDRVARDSLVLAEIKINSRLEKEQDFLIDFSCRLSEIYQRSTSCISIIVLTNASIMLNGSTDSAYYLTISALATEIAATKNKRSAAMIQDFLSDMLQIAPSRGVVKFEAIQEENLATNGCTTMQEIENLERQSLEEKRGMSMTSWHTRSKRPRGPLTSEFGDPVIYLGQCSMRADNEFPCHTGPLPTMRGRKSTNPVSGKVKGRKSIMAFLGLGKADGME